MLFYTWPIKKKMPNQRHVSEFAELDGGGGYFGEFFFYEDANQTGNDIYYRGEKPC